MKLSILILAFSLCSIMSTIYGEPVYETPEIIKAGSVNIIINNSLLPSTLTEDH